MKSHDFKYPNIKTITSDIEHLSTGVDDVMIEDSITSDNQTFNDGCGFVEFFLKLQVN